MAEKAEIVIVGASFAGLACATALAARGFRAVILERKKEPGQAVHTTGIIVKEAAASLDIPTKLTRPISHVRLYAPSLAAIDLEAQDYFFLATDTPNMMRHLGRRAERAGVDIRYGAAFEGAQRAGHEIALGGHDLTCRFLVGADGPRSQVARAFGLGQNRAFLIGAEAEFAQADLPSRDAFYCFLDQKRAHGYLGWVVPGVDVVQVGLAARAPVKPDIDGFITHIGDLFGLDRDTIVARRGGLIPVGGVVSPVMAGNVALTGDAAGLVSPFSAGGIHTADHYGQRLGQVIADVLDDAPGTVQVTVPSPADLALPKFRAKHALRFVYERFAPDWLLNLVIGNVLFRALARAVFFRAKTLPRDGGQAAS